MTEQSELICFYNSLKAVLSNDNQVRLQAETNLKQYLTMPKKLLLYLVKIIQSSEEDYIRKLSSVLFKHYIALKEVSQVWNTLSQVDQDEIKKEILESLRKELDPKVSKQICQAIAELAGVIYSHNKEWPELDGLIMEYLQGNDTLVESAFRILEVQFSLDADRYLKNVPILCQLFDEGIKHISPNCMTSVSMAICTLISNIDTSQVKPFLTYSNYVINTVNVLLNENNEDMLHDYLDWISEVAESEPTYFRNNYKYLCEVLLKVSSNKNYDNEKLRQMPLEMLVSIIERLPRLAHKYKPQLMMLCEGIFDVAISIDDEVDPEWLKPKEGYNIDEDLNPDDNVNFGVVSIDRLLSSLDNDEIFPIIEKIVESSMVSEDWRYRNAGLMIVAQIGEYCEDTDKVKNIIPILISHIVHPHPKVRFARLYAIGFFSEYMYPDFQEEFSKSLIPPMVKADRKSVV